MSNADTSLLSEVETFLAATGMGPSYLGKAAVGNSEVVKRLRKGGDVETETAAKIRCFIEDRKSGVLTSGYCARKRKHQAQALKKSPNGQNIAPP